MINEVQEFMDKPEENREFKINLSPEDIVNKDFKKKYRGYDDAEVDPFLDQVIQDYESFRNRIKTLEQENTRLVKRVDELSRQLDTNGASTPSFNSGVSAVQNTTNYDILRRISNLERHVFGEKEAAKIAGNPATTQPTTPTQPSNNFGGPSQIDRF
ncbi:cell division regulator GpsB [Lapidilactobacillus achengensis]|uniref:Cell division regulator GpsB n=1 Tax=Lapidilactobacillus achengensis TaxID=2486000 RepID=A0ABW1UPJ8_9LACO|nr:cell division regulator GpsB [Lapidilactobacillus achengensis]